MTGYVLVKTCDVKDEAFAWLTANPKGLVSTVVQNAKTVHQCYLKETKP